MGGEDVEGQVFFAFKMAVQRPLRYAAGAGNVFNGGRVDALFHKKSKGRPHHPGEHRSRFAFLDDQLHNPSIVCECSLTI
jgi:hypothetical protein